MPFRIFLKYVTGRMSGVQNASNTLTEKCGLYDTKGN